MFAQGNQLMHFRGVYFNEETNMPPLPIHLLTKKLIKVENLMTLKQACSSEYQGAQGAFKDSMIHWILQFTLLIAFRCVLHRCESQEIRCWKLYIVYRYKTHYYILLHSYGVYENIDLETQEKLLRSSNSNNWVTSDSYSRPTMCAQVEI